MEQTEQMYSKLSKRTRERCERYLEILSEIGSDKIGQVALREGMINYKQLGDALAKQRLLERERRKAPLGEILVEDKALTEARFNTLIPS